MRSSPLLQKVDAVTVPVPDLDSGLRFQSAGGRVVSGPSAIPVGRVAVVADPFGNNLVVLDLSKGRYTTDSSRRGDQYSVTGKRLADVGDQ